MWKQLRLCEMIHDEKWEVFASSSSMLVHSLSCARIVMIEAKRETRRQKDKLPYLVYI